MKYKKFILFQYEQHYPAGGLGDIEGSFDTLEEAKECAKKHHHRDYHYVVDRDTWEVVRSSD